ncbi:MAG: hypothetical protein ACREFX_15475, partial [Opitutaceae bacterium]
LKLVDNLYSEFGAQSRIFNLYVNVLEAAAPSEALAVAEDILAKNPPDYAAGPAHEIVARQALIGKVLKVSLIENGGFPLNLAMPVSHPTIIYFSNGAEGLPILGRYKGSIPAGTRVVYVILEADLTQIAEIEKQAPLPGGIFCFEQSGLGSPEETGFGVLQLPYAYVLDKSGTLLGFGRPEDLPALMLLTTR